MTPEQIITRFKSGFLADRPTMSSSEAIEAIKQYAKQMCDKQKEECGNNAKVHYHSRDFKTSSIAPIVRQKVMISEPYKPSIINAPYPSELQD
jgi:hypothetical protein